MIAVHEQKQIVRVSENAYRIIVGTVYGAGSATESTAGIIRIATQAEVDAGTDNNAAVTPLKLANWAGRARIYADTIGDETNTQFAVTHGFGTRDVHVAVYALTGSYGEIIVDIEHTDANTVTIRFASAPASNAYRVVVMG